jgi:hypothetical protein
VDDFTYSDIKIINDDVALDDSGQPIFIFDREVIAQDIRHAIRESGLLEALIGERNNKQRAIVFNKLKILVESDSRVTPGTSEINEPSIDQILIMASTNFGPINVGAE